MIPGRYDISVWKGGTYDTTLTAKDRKAGTTTDFTKYTKMYLEVKDIWLDGYEVNPTIRLMVDTDSGHIVKGVDNLSINVTLPAVETKEYAFRDGQYILCLVIEDPDPLIPDVVDPFLYGKFTVLGEGPL